MRRGSFGLLFTGAAMMCSVPGAALAQDASDRVDAMLAGAPREADRRREEPNDRIIVQDDPAPLSLDAAQNVTVGAIVITGLNELDNATFAPVIERYIGRTLDGSALAKLAAEIGEVARLEGYVFASAAIAPQTLSRGVLQIQLDEGHLDEVRLTGQSHPAAQRVLNSLVGPGPVKLHELERQLLLAADLPGVRLGDVTLLSEGGRSILQVPVQADRVAGRVYLDNDGSEAFGRYNARLSVDLNGLLDDNDVTSAYLSTTPLQPGQFAYARLDYGRFLGERGTFVSGFASYSRSHPGGYLAARNLRGSSRAFGVAASYPIMRSRDFSLWLESNLTLRDSQQRSSGALIRSDRTTALNLGMTGIAKGDFGRIRFNAQVTRGLDLFDATARDDLLSSRADAGPVFTSLRLSTDWTRQLSLPLSLYFAAQGQLALGPLPSAEELSLGGSRFLRAYDYSEERGDRGFAVSNELRYDFADLGAIRGAQIYGYADAGIVDDLGYPSDTARLASSGAGVRLDLSGGLDANFEVAVPLTGPRYESGSSAARIYFGVAKQF